MKARLPCKRLRSSIHTADALASKSKRGSLGSEATYVLLSMIIIQVEVLRDSYSDHGGA